MTDRQLADIYGFAIIEDTKEQKPLDFSTVTDIPAIHQNLKTGDYSATGYEDQITIERKSISDLIGTVIHDRERFERELTRMREGGFRLRCIFCEGTYADILHGAYRGQSNPASVLGSLDAWATRFGVPTLFCSHPIYNIPEQPRIRHDALVKQTERINREEMAGRIASIIKYFVREQIGKREWDRRMRLLKKAQKAENDLLNADGLDF